MKLSRDLFLGFIKLHLLHHTEKETVYGLWLIDELAGQGYRLSPGTLYPILRGLVEDGCLVSEKKVVGGKARKDYYITALGRSTLAEGKAKALELIDEIK